MKHVVSPKARDDLDGIWGSAEVPDGNYLIHYRPVRSKILVARILHGKRLQRRAFLSK